MLIHSLMQEQWDDFHPPREMLVSDRHSPLWVIKLAASVLPISNLVWSLVQSLRCFLSLFFRLVPALVLSPRCWIGCEQRYPVYHPDHQRTSPSPHPIQIRLVELHSGLLQFVQLIWSCYFDLFFYLILFFQSFTELFLTFLEQEAGLRAPLRLSMDHYTPEAVKPNASRKPAQLTEELEVRLHPWSHSLTTPTTSTTSIPVNVPDTVLSHSSSNRDSKSPLNPLFQM